MNLRALRLSHSAIFLAATLAAPICAFSQQPAAQAAKQSPQAAPSDAPPQMERGEGDEPGITVRQPENKTTVTEKRQGGEVKEIKVKKGKSTYYLKPGSTAADRAQGGTVTHPAQWVIKEFGAGSEKKKDAAAPLALPPAADVPDADAPAREQAPAKK